MKIVNPNDRTTLLLNKYYEPFGVCTARAAFRHLITGRVLGMDATDTLYGWESNNQHTSINWKNRNIQVHDDQPVLRSAPELNETRHWFIPTIVKCCEHFSYRARGNNNISLRKIYQVYKRTCQYCLNVIPFTEATRDHLMPKCKGGTDHDFNIVLACKRCNNKKDDHYPYYNKEGEEVKPKRAMNSGMFLPDEHLIRSEWKKYLYL